ncbi:MAG: lipocalin family protein [Hyphomonadaceae bacterium]
MKQLLSALALSFALATTGCITSSGPGGAPPPVASVDFVRLYTGDWHEIAFRPNWATDGCVAGITRYTTKDKPDEVGVRDSCREKTVDGKEKVVEGTGHILDPGTNAKIRVDYFLFVSRETWVAALADDYSWFITTTPDFGEVNIFTRNPQPGDALIKQLTAKVESWGYDVKLLVFPPQPAK